MTGTIRFPPGGSTGGGPNDVVKFPNACSVYTNDDNTVSYSIYQKTVSNTIFRQLVPQKAAKGVGVLRIIQKNS